MKCRACRIAMETTPGAHRCPSCGAIVRVADVGYVPPEPPPPPRLVTFTREELSASDDAALLAQQTPEAKRRRSAKQSAAIAAKAALLDERRCRCGCGTRFQPTTIRHFYIDQSHRDREAVQRKRRAREAALERLLVPLRRLA